MQPFQHSILLHFLKSKIHNGIFKICLCVRVHIYIFIVWIYLCFHGCSCWCWWWWSSDSFWYQSSVYLLYINVYIQIYIYITYINIYGFFESNQIWIFLNPIQKWPGVGLNIELAGFCAFLPYLFGAIASLGVGKLADKLLEDGRVPWRF